MEMHVVMHSGVLFNPTAHRKAKIVCNFGLSKCNLRDKACHFTSECYNLLNTLWAFRHVCNAPSRHTVVCSGALCTLLMFHGSFWNAMYPLGMYGAFWSVIYPCNIPLGMLWCILECNIPSGMARSILVYTYPLTYYGAFLVLCIL